MNAPPDWLLSLFSGGPLVSGAVSGAEALRVPAVASAVRVIAEAVSTLDIAVVERRADGSTDPVEHPMADLLRGDANDWMAGWELVRDLTMAALTNDFGGMAWVNRVGGEVREIIAYRPSALTVEFDTMTGEPSYRLHGRPVPAGDIIHVRGPFAKCPLSMAAEAIGAARMMERHAAKLFENGARPGGVITSPKQLGDKGVKAMIAAWRAAHDGADKTGKTAILWDGATFSPLMLSSVDAQFLELRKFQILEIARAFRVSPTLLFDFDRATWSNSEQAGKEFLTYTLEPWLKTIEAALGRALLTREERRTRRFLFDRDDLTRADLATRATAINSLIAAKVINANTGREWLGLGPYPGGETYQNPAINPETPGGGTLKTPKTPEAADDAA
ncbi:phage portal protein [Segnochrobactraceae bacterium EtOH-i3]